MKKSQLIFFLCSSALYHSMKKSSSFCCIRFKWLIVYVTLTHSVRSQEVWTQIATGLKIRGYATGFLHSLYQSIHYWWKEINQTDGWWSVLSPLLIKWKPASGLRVLNAGCMYWLEIRGEGGGLVQRINHPDNPLFNCTACYCLWMSYILYALNEQFILYI